MRPIITLCLAAPFVFLSLDTKAQQQLTPTEAARAAAAGPEFCPRGPCPWIRKHTEWPINVFNGS
jgi:hypothetical protein